jgi:hypothetical protein
LLRHGYELLNPDGSTYKAGKDDLALTTRRRSTYKADRLEIVAILRDWSKREYQREAVECEKKGWTPKYPANQVTVLEVPVIDEDTVEQYIYERALEHKKARALHDDALPACSPEERWARPGKWAVIKAGAKKATKLYDTKEEAEAALPGYGAGYKLEERPGEDVRCASYCPVASKCSYAKSKGYVKA